MPPRRFLSLSALAALALVRPAALSFAQGTAPTPAGEILPAQCLVIKSVGRSGRSPIHADAIERQIVLGTWKTPQSGDAVDLPDGSKPTWTTIAPNKDGVFQNGALQGGYAFVSVESPAPRVMLLEASAHNMVYVNGEPRVGDTYQTGWTRLPVQLKAGRNSLLFQCSRGELRCKLSPVKSSALLDTRDLTLPDLIVGEKGPVMAAVIVVNATNAPLSNLTLQARQGSVTTQTPVPTLLPLSTRKIGFVMEGRILTVNNNAPNMQNVASGAQNAGAAGSALTAAPVTLTLTQKGNGRTQTMDTAAITLRIRKPNETQKRTFVSEIDGSVQYYAVNPAQDVTAPSLSSSSALQKGKTTPNGEAPALILSLHGASVEAIGQADAYESKRWAYLVAPTNRRPYGFDWEDWGRLDALEVLDLAQARLQTDPRRTYLTGHSMGGHGTWNLGVTFPDRFAAIAPSAGWISFASYAGGARPLANPTPIQAILQRATLPSDTLALSRNYAQEGIYIIHGDADDNVPVTQARTMVEILRGFHHDFVYFEQPGAGHWWDVSEEPGADCVDWAPLFDFFARRRLPADEDARQVDFVTADPGVSATCHWAAILQQQHALQPSRISLRYDPGLRRFVGTTENVACLALRLDTLRPNGPLALDIDGHKLVNVALPASNSSSSSSADASASTLYLTQGANGWQVGSPLPETSKRPERGGLFKQAFRHRMLFVYGTKGTPEENAWAIAKARFDAETFWYRGNGSIDVVPDTEFVAAQLVSSPANAKVSSKTHSKITGGLSDPDRSVILYGNRDTNAAWEILLADSPVQARRGTIQMGLKTFTGDDLACLFVRPRPHSGVASVGVVGGTGLPAMRLTDRQAYFLSGAAYPDCLVFSPDELRQGSEGILAAGFFGNDWSVETGEFAYGK